MTPNNPAGAAVLQSEGVPVAFTDSYTVVTPAGGMPSLTVETLQSYLNDWYNGIVSWPSTAQGLNLPAEALAIAQQRCAEYNTDDCAQMAALAKAYGDAAAAAVAGAPVVVPSSYGPASPLNTSNVGTVPSQPSLTAAQLDAIATATQGTPTANPQGLLGVSPTNSTPGTPADVAAPGVSLSYNPSTGIVASPGSQPPATQASVPGGYSPGNTAGAVASTGSANPGTASGSGVTAGGAANAQQTGGTGGLPIQTATDWFQAFEYGNFTYLFTGTTGGIPNVIITIALVLVAWKLLARNAPRV